MLAFLRTIAWLVVIVYASIPSFWLLIHPRVEYWRARQRSPYQFLIPVWVTMWIALALITAPWRHISIYKTGWTWVPAAFLFLMGLWLYKSSGKLFSGAQLSGAAEILPAHGEQRLVVSGIRTRIRHPIYLGHLCEMLAWSIGTGLAVAYALTAFAAVTGVVMIRLEDKELEQRFGEEYRRYRNHVPALIPTLWKPGFSGQGLKGDS
jgi:protein-S-isoprenylcysteine O-methyltransferase Ste14